MQDNLTFSKYISDWEILAHASNDLKMVITSSNIKWSGKNNLHIIILAF